MLPEVNPPGIGDRLGRPSVSGTGVIVVVYSSGDTNPRLHAYDDGRERIGVIRAEDMGLEDCWLSSPVFERWRVLRTA